MRYVLDYADANHDPVYTDFQADSRASAIAKAKRLLTKAIKTVDYSLHGAYIHADFRVDRQGDPYDVDALTPFGMLSTMAYPSIVSPAMISFDDSDAKAAIAARAA